VLVAVATALIGLLVAVILLAVRLQPAPGPAASAAIDRVGVAAGATGAAPASGIPSAAADAAPAAATAAPGPAVVPAPAVTPSVPTLGVGELPAEKRAPAARTPSKAGAKPKSPDDLLDSRE
jgi:hypothetical protein